MAEVPLTPDRRRRAIEILQGNPERSRDWIVLTHTMPSLAQFAHDDPRVRDWLIPVLRRHLGDHRKAVATRAGKLLASLEQP
ncbi:MAG: hypothetical protein ACLP50_13035 [Solirubrobacteraceae bacterium]